MKPARVVAAAVCVLLAAGCTRSGPDAEDIDRRAVLSRYVEAWAAGGDALERAVGGGDVDALLAALAPLRAGGVVRTRATDVRLSDGGTAEAAVVLEFGDGGALEVPILARFTDGRVRAEASAVSRRITRLEPLRVETVGPAPRRGSILTRGGTAVARGPLDAREAVRPALEPAIAAIDVELDARLGGEQGRRLVAASADRALAESETVHGDDVRTSLDDGMQMAAERALGTRPGAFVAVDPHTGGIRALVSNPTRDEPDRSPATSGYSPGSAFKIVTAAAALEHDVFDASARIACPARLFVEQRFITNFESVDYGEITFRQAFAVSCNTAFAQIGARVGSGPLLRTAEQLGLRPVPELDGAGTIQVPRNRAELAVWAVGAAGSLTSPVQLAGIGTAVARGGRWLAPSWIDRDEPGRRALTESTAATLVDFMEAVVETGTGTDAAVAGASIAGKTGTGEPEADGQRPNAWFVGLAPSRGTRVVAVALVVGGGLGGEAAAPVVRAFLAETRADWQPIAEVKGG